MSLEQAKQAAQDNNLQEAILKLCEVVKEIESKVSYLEYEKQSGK